MSYALEPRQKIGARVSELKLKGKPARFLRSRRTVPAMRANLPA